MSMPPRPPGYRDYFVDMDTGPGPAEPAGAEQARGECAALYRMARGGYRVRELPAARGANTHEEKQRGALPKTNGQHPGG
jgi:hypothetical protein